MLPDNAPSEAPPKRKVKGKLHVQFELPPGSVSDEDITAKAKDLSLNFRFI